jgi:hypothetical protein
MEENWEAIKDSLEGAATASLAVALAEATTGTSAEVTVSLAGFAALALTTLAVAGAGAAAAGAAAAGAAAAEEAGADEAEAVVAEVFVVLAMVFVYTLHIDVFLSRFTN